MIGSVGRLKWVSPSSSMAEVKVGDTDRCASSLLRTFQLSTKANNRQTYFRNSAPVSPVIAANSESKTSPGIRPEETVSVAMSRIGIPGAIATVPPRAVLLAFLPAQATPR